MVKPSGIHDDDWLSKRQEFMIDFKEVLKQWWVRLALVIIVAIVITPWVWYFRSSIIGNNEDPSIALFTDADIGFDVTAQIPKYVTPSNNYVLRFLVRNTGVNPANVSLSLDHNDLAVNFSGAGEKLPFILASNELNPNEAINEQETISIIGISNSQDDIEIIFGLSTESGNYTEQISIPVEIIPLYISIAVSLFGSLSGIVLWIWKYFIKPNKLQAI